MTSITRQKVYFFTSRSEAGLDAFAQASTLHEADWGLFHIETPAERDSFEAANHAPDVIISFLNPYIIPNNLLKQAAGRAFNVHPALPEYPGRDPEHFAFYEGASTAGATLHQMTAAVDSGLVLDVAEEPVDRTEGVMRFIDVSERLAIQLLMAKLPAILDGTIARTTSRDWRPGPPSSRKRFLEMCRIDPSMDQAEVSRRINSFFNPAYRSVFIELHGFRFVYEPDDAAQRRR